MDPKYFKQITQGGPIEDIMWTCLLCKSRATTNIVKHSNTENHKAAVREIERKNKALSQFSNSHKAGLKKCFQMETDDTDGDAQRSNEITYFLNHSDSESESEAEADTDPNNLSELSSDYQDSLSEISEDMESSADAILETDIDHEILGEAGDWYPFTNKEELGNPLVCNFLELYPEQSAGENIYKLSHSKKWLQKYPRDLRAQMICVGGKHYYIYEPVQLNDGSVIVPIFFYIRGEITPEGKDIIQLPNPWRIKAEEKIIRRVPLLFYADDTSPNVSKQWNKHILILMSLAGLTPKFSNQEFNKLFVATSNISSALELAAPVFEELNKLSASGFTAFDCSIQKDVLVLPVVLLFMADSPMQAEITSKMQPNVSLQPCRICHLNAENKKEKATSTYVHRFIGRKPNGCIDQLDLHCWNATKNKACHTWELFQQRASKNQIQWSIAELGVKDILNQAVMKVIQENQDTRLVFNINKIYEDWKKQLFNPFFDVKGFDYHKNTPVEMLHVVLLGIIKYLYCDIIGGLSGNKKEEVIARLQSFDTGNLNIPPLISTNAQWVNKPKLHMLIHLIQSIAHFGPASLFATEKFESYNGVPLQSSAVYDEAVPLGIKTMSPNSNWIKVISFELDEHQSIKCNSFIYVKAQSTNKTSLLIYLVFGGLKNIYLQCLHCEILQMDTLYGMRTLKKLNREEFISAKSVLSGVNVQHHCAGAKCLIKRTLPMRLVRQVTDIMLKEIHHNFNLDLYVIITASLRSQEYHHDSARIPTPQIQPLDALNAVHDGLSEWKKINNSKGKNKASESMTSTDPSLA
ncbi:hypothetical protein BY996DRAFT_6409842 [Phakopsora pachyrhizi]|nr:hypothetical protein BY996DRAFT_6409842 [Phakopsora pachyrhizi]